MKSLNIALNMEQTLGHKTYFLNLQSILNKKSDLNIHWLKIPYELRAWQARLPLYNNWSIRASWRARRNLIDLGVESMDVLFFHTQVTSLFSVNLMSCVPTIISMDATPLNYDSLGEYYYNHQPADDKAIDKLKFWLNQRAFHAAAAITVWSSWGRRSLIEDYRVDPDKIHVIPAGVNLDLWTTTFRIPKNRPVRILFVGGDFKRKGGYLLLDAWREYLRDRSELHLVTQSDIPPEPGTYVYRDLKPNSPELMQLFAEADIFALPTFADTFGIVLVEAGAAGLPVVSTAIAGIPDIVRQGETGLLCPLGDVKGLAGALSDLIDNPEKRVAMGNRAREIVSAHFDAKKNVERLVQLFQDCAKGKKALLNARLN